MKMLPVAFMLLFFIICLVIIKYVYTIYKIFENMEYLMTNGLIVFP